MFSQSLVDRNSINRFFLVFPSPKPLIVAQSAALVEILHSLTGIVRSPIAATLPQISSRIYITWGILYSFSEIRTILLARFSLHS
ncbi:hypothetical protein ACS0TY_000119 [Phlomoides rotata]